jgi:hypothetical protein
MTLPDERYRAVLNTEQFLLELGNPRATPGVPRRIRERARSLLRHYPTNYQMSCAAEQAPGIFREEMEDLERFIASGLFDKGA